MTDDLTRINGIGPATVEKFAAIGLTTFAGIAGLTDDQVLQLNDDLDLKDKIINGDWRGQARNLMGEQAPEGASPEPQQAPAPPVQTLPVRINRDFWDASGVRHRKGTVIEVSVDEALDGVEAGTLSRVK